MTSYLITLSTMLFGALIGYLLAKATTTHDKRILKEEIDYLKDNDIEYLLIHEDLLYGSSNMSKFIRYYLRPYFYNESEHETENYRLYYAPYFD